MRNLKENIKHLFYYGGSLASVKMIPLISLLVLSHYLNKSDIGIYSIFLATVIFIVPFIGGEFLVVLCRKQVRLDQEKYAKWYMNSVYSTVLLSIIAFIVVVVFAGYKNIYIGLDVEYCIYASVMAMFQALLVNTLSYFQMKQESYMFFKIQFINLSIYFVLFLAFFLTRSISVNKIIISQITASGITFLYASFKMGGVFNLKLEFDPKIIFHLYYKSMPLVIYITAAFYINTFMRFQVKHYLGISLLALFTIAHQIAAIMQNADAVVTNVWTPMAYKILVKVDNGVLTFDFFVKKALLAIVTLLLFGVVVFIVAILLYKFFVPRDYFLGFSACLVMIVAYVIKSFYSIIAVWFYYHQKTIFVSLINIAIALVSLLISGYMIKHYLILGASSTIVFSYTLLLFSIVFIVLISIKKNSANLLKVDKK